MMRAMMMLLDRLLKCCLIIVGWYGCCQTVSELLDGRYVLASVSAFVVVMIALAFCIDSKKNQLMNKFKMDQNEL